MSIIDPLELSCVRLCNLRMSLLTNRSFQERRESIVWKELNLDRVSPNTDITQERCILIEIVKPTICEQIFLFFRNSLFFCIATWKGEHQRKYPYSFLKTCKIHGSYSTKNINLILTIRKQQADFFSLLVFFIKSSEAHHNRILLQLLVLLVLSPLHCFVQCCEERGL